jgi:hypothetical protein
LNLSNLQLPYQQAFAAGAGGLVALVIIAALQLTGHDLGFAADGALIVFLPPLLAKIVPPSQQDVLKHINDEIAQAGVLVGKLTAASDQSAPPTDAAKALAAKVPASTPAP